VTREGKIIGLIGAAVLFGDNVLDVVHEFAVILRQQTIFATIPGSLPNKVARGRIHR
jgi:hypothetical protein